MFELDQMIATLAFGLIAGAFFMGAFIAMQDKKEDKK